MIAQSAKRSGTTRKTLFKIPIQYRAVMKRAVQRWTESTCWLCLFHLDFPVLLTGHSPSLWAFKSL
jgi:hypothetical protein